MKLTADDVTDALKTLRDFVLDVAQEQEDEHQEAEWNTVLRDVNTTIKIVEEKRYPKQAVYRFELPDGTDAVVAMKGRLE